MAPDNELLIELYRLRAELKDQGKAETGRTPLVCTDDALEGIAELRPKTVSDFGAVPGIGSSFMENYAPAFLEVIDRYRPVSESAVAMDASVSKVMKELEKKLVSLNRRNRMLYLPKIVERYSFDISYLPDLYSLLFSGKEVVLGDPRTGDLEDESRYRRAVKVIRDAEKDLRDKGQNDLYVAYPFVKGRLSGEDFDVRAPLALFPVKAVRGGDVRLRIDPSRDPVYNSVLILAQQKFTGISKPLPDCTIDDAAAGTFISDLSGFYRSNGLELKDDLGDVDGFRSYLADQFPRYAMGELHIERCAVLGKFPSCTSAVQRDFETMLEEGMVNSLLKDLLSKAEDLDFRSDGPSEPMRMEEPKEEDLFYINRLDASQENVLSALSMLDSLVVQGPPGTGKSQVITSLITDYASRGKTVILVSEKKTALDVVYSRLGPLSKYAMLVDDVSNKDLFYGQLRTMLDSASLTAPCTEGLDAVSMGIDHRLDRLRELSRVLYTPDDFGIEPYKLYRMDTGIRLEDQASYNRYKKVGEAIVPSLTAADYATLERCRDIFVDPRTAARLDTFIGIERTYPWLRRVRQDMSRPELFAFGDAARDLDDSVAEWRSKNFLARIFTKGKLKKKARAIQSEYFTAADPADTDLMVTDPKSIRMGISDYDAYTQVRPAFDALTPIERDYLSSVTALAGSDRYADASTAIFNRLVYDRMERFEAAHKDVMCCIDDFDSIVDAIGKEVEHKRDIARSSLESTLSAEIAQIGSGKRGPEIRRVVESKRRWSVSRFITKFRPEILSHVRIWLMTPEVVSEILPLDAGVVDLVIFDEASQMYVEKGLPAIMRGKKVVVAGDHKQLRPSSLGAGRIDADLGEGDESDTAALEEESLLDLARFRYRDVMLRYHYRSRYEELIAFSNYAFYHGQLFVCPNPEPPEKPPIEVHMMKDARWQNRSNLKEAEYTVKLLKQILKERKESETIGIITFNITQRDLIDDTIDRECRKDPAFAAMVDAETGRVENGEDVGLFVKNIETVQGDERDIIIFSVGYAKNESGRLVRNFGWLGQEGGENRLNVAVSRSKKKVHVVMSFDPEDLDVSGSKNDGPKLLKSYLQYSCAVSSGDTAAAESLLTSFGDTGAAGDLQFDSDFENQVYDALSARGLQVDTQVGVGGYRIDLAVRKDGKYVLGIECDGKLYHSSSSARERDFHRQNYLESRGWRIHRIWSTKWWKNPEGEIDRICAIVNAL